MITALVLLIYFLLFARYCLRYGQWHWYFVAMVAWLFAGILGAMVLPGVLGPLHWANLYPIYGYVFIGSAFLLLGSYYPDPHRRGWHFTGAGAYLPRLAISGLIQHLSLLLLLIMVWLAYPHGVSIWALSGLLKLYFFQPVYWMVSQWVLMLVMVWHRHCCSRSAPFMFGKGLLQGLFLMSLLFQVAYLLLDALSMIQAK